MCGIFGIINKKKSDFDKTTFNVLGINNDTRGGDSCGVFIDGRYEYGVDDKSYYEEFFETSKILKTTTKCTIAIGHDRKASVGKIDKTTAQPIVLKNKKGEVEFVVIHNGTIYNYLDLAKKYIPGVKIEGLTDSQVMARIFYYKGYDVLEEYNGGAVFVVVDYRQPKPKVLFFKGASKKYNTGKEIDERSFYFSIDPKQGLVFSSISTYLKALRPEGEVYTIKANQLIDYNNETCKMTIIKNVDRSKQQQTKEYTNKYSFASEIPSKWSGYSNSKYSSGGCCEYTESSYVKVDYLSNTYSNKKGKLHGEYHMTRYGKFVSPGSKDSEVFNVWFFNGIALKGKEEFKFLEYFNKKTKLDINKFTERYQNLVRSISVDGLYWKEIDGEEYLVKAISTDDFQKFTGGFQMLGQSSNKQYLVGRYTGDCYSGFDRPFVFRDEKDKFNIKSFYKICKLLMKSAVIK